MNQTAAYDLAPLPITSADVDAAFASAFGPNRDPHIHVNMPPCSEPTTAPRSSGRGATKVSANAFYRKAAREMLVDALMTDQWDMAFGTPLTEAELRPIANTLATTAVMQTYAALHNYTPDRVRNDILDVLHDAGVEGSLGLTHPDMLAIADQVIGIYLAPVGLIVEDPINKNDKPQTPPALATLADQWEFVANQSGPQGVEATLSFAEAAAALRGML